MLAFTDVLDIQLLGADALPRLWLGPANVGIQVTMLALRHRLTPCLSPAYALRSYLYILIHAIFGKVADLPIRVIMGMNKVRSLSRSVRPHSVV